MHACMHTYIHTHIYIHTYVSQSLETAITQTHAKVAMDVLVQNRETKV